MIDFIHCLEGETENTVLVKDKVSELLLENEKTMKAFEEKYETSKNDLARLTQNILVVDKDIEVIFFICML